MEGGFFPLSLSLSLCRQLVEEKESHETAKNEASANREEFRHPEVRVL